MIWLPVHVFGKMIEGGPGAGTPDTCVGNQAGVSGSWPWPGHLGDEPADGGFLILSFPPSLLLSVCCSAFQISNS